MKPISVQAETIGFSDSQLRASGNVEFRVGNRRMTADSVDYNLKTMSGHLSKAYFTTCSAIRPEYHIVARELEIFGNTRFKAHGAALYLGRHRIIALPLLVSRVGGRAASFVFPKPGFDKDDGATLSHELAFIDEQSVDMCADLRLTTKRGIQGEVWSNYGIDGTIEEMPGRFISYDSMRSSVVTVPRTLESGSPDTGDIERPRPARFREYTRIAMNRRTYSVQNPSLLVSRMPEIGLRYIAEHRNFTKTKLAPILQIYPEITCSWGRFKQEPGPDDFVSRYDIGAVATANVIPLGANTAVQPVVSYSTASYGNGDSYRNWAYALDASHLFPNGSIVTGRYIRREQSGRSPFLFDVIDISNELQGAFQLRFARHVIGFVAGYDVDKGEIYDWETVYGYRTDCVVFSLGWHDRVQRLSFDINLINL